MSDWSNSETWECCTDSKPCGLGEGDCDNNEDCLGNLLCGKDNCSPPFHEDADCCYDPTTSTTATTTTTNFTTTTVTTGKNG